MDNITPEIVRTLLNTLVTPKSDLIVDYDINTRKYYGGKTGIEIDVIMEREYNYNREIEYDLERRIKNVMRYLSPAFTLVKFYIK
jgi:hypothetical protein